MKDNNNNNSEGVKALWSKRGTEKKRQRPGLRERKREREREREREKWRRRRE